MQRPLNLVSYIWGEYGCHPNLGQHLLPPQLQPLWSAMLCTVAWEQDDPVLLRTPVSATKAKITIGPHVHHRSHLV